MIASVEGTWTQNGSTISLTATSLRVNGQLFDADGETITAQFATDRITMVDPSDPPHTMVFVKM